MVYVPDARARGRRSRLLPPFNAQHHTGSSLRLSQLTSFESLLQHSPSENYNGKAFYEGVVRVEELQSNTSIGTTEKRTFKPLKEALESPLADELARQAARGETGWAAWKNSQKDACAIITRAQGSATRKDEGKKMEQTNKKSETHAPKASSAWVPSRYNRGALGHHQRRLVEIFKSKEAGILEISSQGRQPLPPALARALNARTLLGQGLGQCSRSRQPVRPALVEALHEHAVAQSRRLTTASQTAANAVSPEAEAAIAKKWFGARLEAQVAEERVLAQFSQSSGNPTVADIGAFVRILDVRASAGRSPPPVCQPSPQNIQANVEALERALDSGTLPGRLLPQVPLPPSKFLSWETCNLGLIIRKYRTQLASKEAANKRTNSYFQSIGSATAAGNSSDALDKLFEKYRVSTDEKDSIGVEGTMQYLQDLGVNLENAEILLVCEIVQAPVLGELAKQPFIDGWKAIGADTISKQIAYVKGQVTQLPTDAALFKRVYKHTFICAKEKGQKALPLENALVYWEMLFTSPGKQIVTDSNNWLALWLEFLKAKYTKSVNKDMWNQTLEFFLKATQDESLSFWTEDGAWPGVIDEFVAHVKAKRGDTMETD